MFANCQKGGVNMAAPDVCKTPMGNSTPPIPYPNIAQGATANPGTIVQKVLICGAPAHTIQTVIPMSNGDNPGVCGGVISGCNMSQQKHTMGANNVLMGGKPATKLTDPTAQNGSNANAYGATVTPAQTKVMIMSGGSTSSSSSDSLQNQSEDSNKPVQMSVKNPRWEQSDQEIAKKRKDTAVIGDKIVLKADLKNVPDGNSVSFWIYDNAVSPAKRVAIVKGTANSGIGSAQWKVTRWGMFEFEAKVSSLISDRAIISISVNNDFVYSM